MNNTLLEIYASLDATYTIPMPDLASIDVLNFKSKILETDSCSYWLAGLNSSGYGQFYVKGIAYGAHRISYWLHYNKDPNYLQVQHNCNVRPCINPLHLTLGTNHENQQYRVKSGHLKIKDELNPNSKHTNEEILQIRSLDGKLTHKHIGKMFNMSRTDVTRITRRLLWTHI